MLFIALIGTALASKVCLDETQLERYRIAGLEMQLCLFVAFGRGTSADVKSDKRQEIVRAASAIARARIGLYRIIIQILPLASAEHRPTPTLQFGDMSRPWNDVKMHVRHHLRGTNAVVLHDIVVGYSRDFGHRSS